MLSYGSHEYHMLAGKLNTITKGSKVILGNKCVHTLKNQGIEP